VKQNAFTRRLGDVFANMSRSFEFDRMRVHGFYGFSMLFFQTNVKKEIQIVLKPAVAYYSLLTMCILYTNSSLALVFAQTCSLKYLMHRSSKCTLCYNDEIITPHPR